MTIRKKPEDVTRSSPRNRADLARMSHEEVHRLVHALEAHQIELEMQNEELRNAQSELEYSRARYAHLYDFAPVGYLTLTPDAVSVEANLTMARMLETERQRLLHVKVTRFIARESQEAWYFHLQGAIKGGNKRHRCELMFRRADGSTFPVQIETVRSRPEFDHEERFECIVSDITEHRIQQRHLEIRNAVSQILGEAATVLEAVPKILQAVCEGTDRDAGALWLVNPSANQLQCAAFWRAQDMRMTEFERETRRLEFARGRGLLGRVWETGEPMIASDLTKVKGFVRAQTSRRAALVSGFAFPIKLEHRTLGVIECYSRQRRGLAAPFLDMLTAVSQKLGQFIERMGAEEALRESEAHLRSILNSALDAVVTVDQQDRITGWNPRAERIFGWTREEVLGRPMAAAIFASRLRASHQRCLKEYLKTGRRSLVERVSEGAGRHRSGREFPIEFTMTPVATAAGLSFCLFLRDITDRKEAGRELHEANAALRRLVGEFQTLIETAPVGIAVARDASCLDIWGNREMSALLGTSSNLNISKTGPAAQELSFDAFRDGRHVSPADLPMQRACRSGRKMVADELEIRRADGQTVHVLCSATPLRDERRKVRGCIGTFLDIARRKQAEQAVEELNVTLDRRVKERTLALRVREQYLRTIMDTAAEGIVTLDKRGRIVSMNPAALSIFGFAADELAGRPFSQLILSRDRARELARRIAHPNDGDPDTLGAMSELTGRRKDGSEVPLEMHQTTFTHGGRSGCVVTVRDLTERRRLERELIKVSDRERQKLGQELHDDLGQMLHGAQFLLSELQLRLEKQRRAEAEDLAKINHALESALGTTRSLARGLQPVPPLPEGLMNALRDQAARIQGVFKVKCRFVCRNPVLVRDPEVATHLFRIAQEAATNAVKHSGCTRIVIRLKRTPARLVLGIRDDGHGRFPEAGKRHGMGLHVMQFRATSINGSLLVQRRPGKGTEVICAVEPFSNKNQHDERIPPRKDSP